MHRLNKLSCRSLRGSRAITRSLGSVIRPGTFDQQSERCRPLGLPVALVRLTDLWFQGVHGDVAALGRDVGSRASPADLLSQFRFGGRTN